MDEIKVENKIGDISRTAAVVLIVTAALHELADRSILTRGTLKITDDGFKKIKYLQDIGFECSAQEQRDVADFLMKQYDIHPTSFGTDYRNLKN